MREIDQIKSQLFKGTLYGCWQEKIKLICDKMDLYKEDEDEYRELQEVLSECVMIEGRMDSIVDEKAFNIWKALPETKEKIRTAPMYTEPVWYWDTYDESGKFIEDAYIADSKYD